MDSEWKGHASPQSTPWYASPGVSPLIPNAWIPRCSRTGISLPRRSISSRCATCQSVLSFIRLPPYSARRCETSRLARRPPRGVVIGNAVPCDLVHDAVGQPEAEQLRIGRDTPREDEPAAVGGPREIAHVLEVQHEIA